MWGTDLMNNYSILRVPFNMLFRNSENINKDVVNTVFDINEKTKMNKYFTENDFINFNKYGFGGISKLLNYVFYSKEGNE